MFLGMSHDLLPSSSPRGERPFRIVMRPHRSLSGPGFVVLMAAISFVSFVTGIAFTLMGAWPVFGFFGLDVALVYWAFQVNYRRGREIETIEIDGSHLRLTRQTENGEPRITELLATWVAVRPTRAGGRACLALASHGKEHPFGAFLTEKERGEVSAILWNALLQARGGPRI